MLIYSHEYAFEYKINFKKKQPPKPNLDILTLKRKSSKQSQSYDVANKLPVDSLAPPVKLTRCLCHKNCSFIGISRFSFLSLKSVNPLLYRAWEISRIELFPVICSVMGLQRPNLPEGREAASKYQRSSWPEL